ncbi:SRPBCC domain-containing protein [Chitinophaga sp. Cy-1792]|uniref:SRPBCC family protein n=1 Tax=Chitinophaga sp. Cy-1792 TaxID=2608339 RepID=UPI001423561C|nr:SRPBCC domain-containing protein [Chitinophaga sp. Cy-1792]NIG56461.1 SRPBCC domain-containing protein [Chitinophaga sp. Cy-1792]
MGNIPLVVETTATPLVVERVYDAPIESVWDAITNNEKLQKWYFRLPEFKAEKGFQFTFICTCDGVDNVHFCEVTEVIPGRKLAYTWNYEGVPGSSTVSWELHPEGSKTRLVLTHTGLETFAGVHPLSSFAEGWDHFINNALPKFLEA